jgi:hypothetical protein
MPVRAVLGRQFLKYTRAGYLAPVSQVRRALGRVAPPPSEATGGDSAMLCGGIQPTKPTKPQRLSQREGNPRIYVKPHGGPTPVPGDYRFWPNPAELAETRPAPLPPRGLPSARSSHCGRTSRAVNGLASRPRAIRLASSAAATRTRSVTVAYSRRACASRYPHKAAAGAVLPAGQ